MNSKFRLFSIILLAAGFCSAASLIGFDALGVEQSPQNAAIIRNGLAPQNPALNAFENKTKFGTTLQFEYAIATSDTNSISLGSLTVPSLSMVLPLGLAGTFGISLNQKYFANNRIELIDPALDANILYISRTGIYELAPSYSLRLPYLNDFAVGLSYRIFFGNSYSALERGKSVNLGDDDSWKAGSTLIRNVETGDFEAVGSQWQRLGGSLHFHRKNTDYFFSYFPAVDMRKNISSRTQFSNYDTLKTTKESQYFEIPEHFASGMHFIFLQNHNISLVYERQNSEEDINSYFVEYKRTGTSLHYSPFFKRNNFGASAWHAEKNIKDVAEYGASIFSDMWLGRRGTIIGLALFGGYRDAKDPYWDEPFFGFKLSLYGVGNWGASSRRR